MKDQDDSPLWQLKEKNTKLSIINVYRPWDDNDNTIVSKIIIQQLNILEERYMEVINIRPKMINDLSIFINSLQTDTH